jgi:phosphoribosylanthranilate isomerase
LFRIKICGVTNPDDALAVLTAGADALGLNFYARSPRFVSHVQAAEIVRATAGRAVKVGVFVNAEAASICQTFDELQLDLIQLHGDEPPELLRQLAARPVMRAFRLNSADLAPIDEYLARCRALGCSPRLVLIDAHREGQYGGTGQTADWQLLAEWQRRNFPPLVLAGGLTPANAATAIATVRPAAVDTASGVEVAPGKKDHNLVAAFVQAARSGFSELQSQTPAADSRQD